MTSWAYRSLKIPIPVARGWGLSLLPRPVALSHQLAGPFYPPKVQQGRIDVQIEAFHQQICAQMDALIARQLRGEIAPKADEKCHKEP